MNYKLVFHCVDTGFSEEFVFKANLNQIPIIPRRGELVSHVDENKKLVSREVIQLEYTFEKNQTIIEVELRRAT